MSGLMDRDRVEDIKCSTGKGNNRYNNKKINKSIDTIEAQGSRVSGR